MLSARKAASGKRSAACRRLNPKAPVFDEVLTLIQGMIPFDAASLYLYETENDRYVLKATMGEEVSLPGTLLARDQLHPDRWRPTARRPLLWSYDIEEAGLERERSSFSAMFVVPLCLDATDIGLLNLASYSKGVLSEKQIKLITVVADQLAVSVERLEYVARIEAQHHTLQESHDKLRADQARLVAEEKLNAIANLATTINHQINNPLSVIVGNVECLALEETGFTQRSRDRLKRIVKAALKVGEVNRRLLKIQTLLNNPSPASSAGENPAAPFSG
jgi:signal transduction histidine kinase